MDTTYWAEGVPLPEEMRDPTVGYEGMLPIWEACRDAIRGTAAIKRKGTKYLPPLESHLTAGHTMVGASGSNYWGTSASDFSYTDVGFLNMSAEGRRRYENYKNSAQFPAASFLTKRSYLNMIFRKKPELFFRDAEGEPLKLDEKELLDFSSDMSSRSENLEVFTQRLASELLATNRVGMLEDWGWDKSHTILYTAEQIYNYGVVYFRGKEVINYYTLIEYENNLPRLRVLYLDLDPDRPEIEPVYRQAVFVLQTAEGGEKPTFKGRIKEAQFVCQAIYTPTHAERKVKGETFSYIPFYIASTDGADPRVIQEPPLYSLVDMELGAYQNSANNEQELKTNSIKTAVFPGYDVDEYGVPAMGGAIICDADPACHPYLIEAKYASKNAEAIDTKYNNMAKLGSAHNSSQGRYLQAQKTAEMSSFGDIVSVENIARTLEEVLNRVLTVKMNWVTPDRLVFIRFNADYFDTGINTELFKANKDAYIDGTISFHTFFNRNKQMGVYPEGWTEDAEKQGIEDDRPNISLSSAESITKETMNMGTTISSERGGDVETESKEEIDVEDS